MSTFGISFFIFFQGFAKNPRYKAILCGSSLFQELVGYNLRFGSSSQRGDVRSLLCSLIRDNEQATEKFNDLLIEKIRASFQPQFMICFDFFAVRHEMTLIMALFENEDRCWEARLNCVLKLFIMALQNKSPAVLEMVVLPCLRILYNLFFKPSVPVKSGKRAAAALPATSTTTAASSSTAAPASTSNASGSKVEQVASIQPPPVPSTTRLAKIPFDSLMLNLSVNLGEWISSNQSSSSYSNWRQGLIKLTPTKSQETGTVHFSVEQLQRKYFFRWLYLHKNGNLKNAKSQHFALMISKSTWIQEILFNQTSKALRVACKQLLLALFDQITNKQQQLIDLFTSLLSQLCVVGGEVGIEYYDLYRSIIFSEFAPVSGANPSQASGNVNVAIVKNHHWRYYLTLCGLLQYLGKLITVEIDRLKQLEETTLSTNFSQGSALRQLVELLQLFMRDVHIRRVHKSSMLSPVLDGYLSLRKLIVQRTKMIDESQAALLELLELLTTGTRDETIQFMRVCIESVSKCPLDDLRTPVFIFERLCSIIHPEEKESDEFYIMLEKDPQQEDFLQGRMLGNPYSCKDPGMGPLMRNIKNKICQECELVSLLEDDSSLELLVNNKIMSLDLPVKDVYKKIVLAEAAAAASSSASQAPERNQPPQQAGGIGTIRPNWNSLFGRSRMVTTANGDDYFYYFVQPFSERELY